MEEIKSALEKALERAEELGELTAEELRKSKEAEYLPIGEGIAKRFLRHGSSSIMNEEINKYTSEEKEMVIKGALATFRGVIDLENSSESESALAGIRSLKPEEQVEHICHEIESLLTEYQEAKQRRYEAKKEAVEKSVKELLHRLRISGSAIGEINPRVSKVWEQIISELRSRFEPRLDELKQALAEALEK